METNLGKDIIIGLEKQGLSDLSHEALCDLVLAYRAELAAAKVREASLKEQLVYLRGLNKSLSQKVSRYGKKLKKEQGKGDLLRSELAADAADLRAKHHHYELSMIRFGVFCYCRLNLSLRQSSAVIREFNLAFGLDLEAPSHESIRLWSLKLGFERLSSSCEELANEAVALIVDESFQVGQESLLLFLAVRLKTWLAQERGERSVGFSDVDVVFAETKPSWTGELIGEKLASVIEDLDKVGASVCYVTSDKGRAILNGVKAVNQVSIGDCTHHFALFLEHRYEHLADFKDLMTALACLRKQWHIGKNAGFIPPKQRSKSRFLNLFEVVKWTEEVSASLATDNPIWTTELRQKLSFLGKYQALIAESSNP